jgi:hypothetical protein
LFELKFARRQSQRAFGFASFSRGLQFTAIYTGEKKCLNAKRNKQTCNFFLYGEDTFNRFTHFTLKVGPSWVQQLAPLIKSSNACAPFFTKSCDVLSGIVRHAPDFAEVSKQITSVASNLVTSLIDCAKINPGATYHVMDCIKNLQTFYFGAIGPAIKHLEKFIMENMVKILKLVKMAALLPPGACVALKQYFNKKSSSSFHSAPMERDHTTVHPRRLFCPFAQGWRWREGRCRS